jgi:predicted permease
LFSNLIGLFSLIGIGFFLVRTKVVSSTAVGALTALLMKVGLPATIFVSMVRPFETDFLRDAVIMIGIGFVMHPAYAVFAWLCAPWFRVPEGRRGMWTMCCAFCNNGFMGFPVAYALFGEEGLALAVMLGVPFNLLVYTLGAKLVAVDCAGENGSVKLPWRKVCFSIINLSIGLGLVVYCAQIPIHEAILSPIRHLANITTPLSMLVTGMSLAEGKLRDAILDKDAGSISFMRLLFLPVLTWIVLELLPIANPLVEGVTLIIMAMPCAAAAVIMGEEYGGCTRLGARAVFLSSLLCIGTIPLISMLL